MALTGFADGPPLICPAPLASCAAGVALALEAIAPGAFTALDAAALLGERAAIAGLRRNGAIAPGGACRLLQAEEGALAVNLARDEDWALLPAWLETDIAPDWDTLGAHLATRASRDLIERARLLGLAVAPEQAPQARAWFAVQDGARRAPPAHPPLVVDLSSLWAGPLASHLLQQAGAHVIKVESVTRPDGARRGPPTFFDLFNAGKEPVTLDFTQERDALRALIESADIVIEASRPRALRQLDINADALIKGRPGLVWISITGYGRLEPEADWIAFGDDAGIAAGLSHIMREADGRSVFCADAVADPLTGLHAALAALAAYRMGRGGLFSIALRDVAAHCALFNPPAEGWKARAADWAAHLAAQGIEASPPRARPC